MVIDVAVTSLTGSHKTPFVYVV